MSLLGDVAVGDRGPPCILDKADGSVVGGHLIEAYVRPTLEVVLIQWPSYLHPVAELSAQTQDPEIGLALIDIA